ncbi:MAG: Ig-like domain-containing protein, partial [Planctomycetota bacterium]
MAIQVPRSLVALSAPLLVLGLGACGGGGGPPLSPDGPQVTATTPDDGATGVPNDSIVSATFGEAMNPATISATSFTLYPEGMVFPVAASVSYDHSANKALLAPNAPLSDATGYRAQLGDSIAAEDGTRLGDDFAWNFETPIDSVPPVVVATTPIEGATGVAPDIVVTATFSEAMDPATIVASTVTLHEMPANDPVAGTVDYAATSNTVAFTPDAPLRHGFTYVARIGSSVQDAAGVSMPTSVTWNFTITNATGPDANWRLLGAQLDPAGAPAGESVDPTMRISAGQPLVGYRHAQTQAYLQAWDEGIGWRDPLGGEANAGPLAPVLYTGPAFVATDNAVFLAYAQAGDGAVGGAGANSQVLVRRWGDITGWVTWNDGDEVSVPYSPNQSAGADALSPALTTGEGGQPVVAWVEAEAAGDDDDEAVWAAEVTAPSSVRYGPLQRDTENDTNGSPVRVVDIAGNPAGTYHYIAHWEAEDNDPAQTRLYVSYLSDGGFGTAENVAIATDYSSGTDLGRPSVAVDLDGTVYVAYARTDTAGNRRVWVQRRSGSTWKILGSAPLSALAPEERG